MDQTVTYQCNFLADVLTHVTLLSLYNKLQGEKRKTEKEDKEKNGCYLKNTENNNNSVELLFSETVSTSYRFNP
jgi:hypothetical protein